MIRRFPAFAALLCILLSLAWGQSRVGEWRHYTSTISPQALAYHDGQIYMATRGGVLVYDPQEGVFSTIAVAEGLVYTDLNYLTIAGDWIWLGGAPPQGIIQVMNLSTGEVDVVDLGLDEILRIVVREDRGFAAFRQGKEVGIVELRWDGNRFAFADIYRNLHTAVTEIFDLDIDGDSLYVSTNSGLLANDYRLGNLKDPLTWTVMAPEGVTDASQYHIDSTGHYLLVRGRFYHRGAGGWEAPRFIPSYTPRQLIRRANGDFVISFWDYPHVLYRDKGQDALPRVPGNRPITAFTEAEGQLFAAVKNRGLAQFDAPGRTWIFLLPNSMAGQSYAAIIKLRTGEMVAAGVGGITRFNGDSWYNIIPGASILSSPEDRRIHGNAQVSSSPFFLADTIYFQGQPSWNMAELPDGSIMVGLRGSYPEKGGILHFRFDDLENYRLYDTTSAALDGFTADGFMTVRQLARDRGGNIWIANPFCELRENVLAVYTADGEWLHFSTFDSQFGSRYALNLAPTEIAFDDKDRVWVGSQVNAHWGSPGGIAVLDYGGTLGAQGELDPLEGKVDDKWALVTARLEAGHSNTVWSLVFDHNQVLWTVSPAGVMGYYVEPNLTLTPYTSFGPYLSDVPFGEGSKIRVDARNNKWITTPQYGLWVLLDNTTFWPSVEGINAWNSSLTTDEILDIYLDDNEGVAYLATSKGISALKIPFKKELDDYSGMVIFPSPYHIPPDPPNKWLVIDEIRQGSSVKIFTATGRLVRELSATDGSVQGYQAVWNGRNSAGELVGSGVYLIAAYLRDGRSGVGKVAVIRR